MHGELGLHSEVVTCLIRPTMLLPKHPSGAVLIRTPAACPLTHVPD
jgi:hypothetical protein